MTKFNYVSLFSGVGGFEQALNSLGGACVFASEIDKFASQAYKTLYGDEHLHGDVTKIDAKDVPDHDVLVGGFPCQAFSVAGRREGFGDTRGTLFFDIARIAAKKKPKALLLENVKGLVNHDKGNTLDTMIRTLNEIGYVVDFDILNSKYFDVPQNRERIFIVAIRKDLIESEAFDEESTKGQTIIPKGKRRIGEWADVFNFDFPEQDEVTTRLRDVLEPIVDEKYYLSDDKTTELVAQLKELDINDMAAVEYDRRKGVGKIRDISLSLSASDWRGLNRNQTQTAVAQEIANGENISYCIDEIQPPKYRIRKLTPLECFRLQAFPDESHQSLVDVGISDSQRYKMAGNAVTVSVIEALGERLIPLIA